MTQGIKYYVMQYTTHDGKTVLNVTNRRDVHERDKKQHQNNPDFKFWEVDRFLMILNETDGGQP